MRGGVPLVDELALGGFEEVAAELGVLCDLLARCLDGPLALHFATKLNNDLIKPFISNQFFSFIKFRGR